MPRRNMRIVDDNPENLTVLGELLRTRYKVRAANSGPPALQLATQAPLPDLILLDVMMPSMSGYEVLEQLGAVASTRDIPVSFITAMRAPLAWVADSAFTLAATRSSVREATSSSRCRRCRSSSSEVRLRSVMSCTVPRSPTTCRTKNQTFLPA